MSALVPLKNPWPRPRPGQTWRFDCGWGAPDVLRVSALANDGEVHFAPVYGGQYGTERGAVSHVESMTALPQCERWTCLDAAESEQTEA